MTKSKGEGMTYKEAKKLVKERAGSKYEGTRLRLLERMVGATYNPNKPEADIENIRVSKGKATLCFWAGVQMQQMLRALAGLDEVTVVSRKNNNITFTLNLDGLIELPKTSEMVRNREKQKKADRAEKARLKRAANRPANKLAELQRLLKDMRPRFYESIRKPSSTRPESAVSKSTKWWPGAEQTAATATVSEFHARA
jgi:hypothetical protein